MFLPELQETNQVPVMTSTFLGINRADSIADGELADCVNLTSDRSPLLSPRKQRTIASTFSNPTGLLGKDILCVCDGGTLDIGGQKFTDLLDPTITGPRQMVSMGAYLCIWPDKAYINTADFNDRGHMDASWRRAADTSFKVQLSMCRLDGTDYDMNDIIVSADAPSNPTNGMLWIDSSTDKHILKQYAGDTESWIEVATVYVKISATGIGAQYKEYDTVDISGLTYPMPDEPDDTDRTLQAQVDFLNASSILYGAGTDYIIVAGIIDQHVTCKDGVEVSVKRPVPDCDFIIENNNRLWGCFYGMKDGKVLNEIYATKLGDFKNWNNFMGLSTDSYTVSVGTDGKFTGAATLKGYPCFFKENCVHKIGGMSPSTFQMNTTMCRGIQEGSERSAVVLGELLYYKARTGIMQYDGSTPTAISNSLGSEVYHDAVGGGFGNKYYVSMRDAKDAWHLFVWDAAKGMWLREDDLHAIAFTSLDDSMFVLDANTNADGTHDLIDLNGVADGTKEGQVDWEATFGVFGYEQQDQKYLTRFNIRMWMPEGSMVRMYIQYDSDGIWHDEGIMKSKLTRTFMLPVIPRRCDHCQIKLVGKGDAKVFSIARIYEDGSDG